MNLESVRAAAGECVARWAQTAVTKPRARRAERRNGSPQHAAALAAAAATAHATTGLRRLVQLSARAVALHQLTLRVVQLLHRQHRTVR